MKTKTLALALALPLLATLALCLPVSAAEKKPADEHGHAHEHEAKVAGPNGGRVLTEIEPHAEFFVTPERKVQITFLGEDGKPTAPAGQVITVTAGERAAPTKLAFTKTATGFVSEGALPAGNNFPAVVQIKATPDAKTVTARFNVNLTTCPECSLAEYACVCEH